MESNMIIYETESGILRDPADATRFEKSIEALLGAGIQVSRVMCKSVDDLLEGEARAIVEQEGLDSLPICEYNGVEICRGQYPSDQDLADFLDVPDGVLSVDRTKPPAMGNDLPPACACRPVR